MTVACLVDTTLCMGCRSCQVACKQSNELPADDRRHVAATSPLVGTGRFTANTFTYVSFHESPSRDGDPAWTFVKRQCMHCAVLYCNSVCAQQVFHRTESGVVDYYPDRCMGCGACLDTCPFSVPTIDYWGLTTPHMRKCSFCLARQETPIDGASVNGSPLNAEELARHRASFRSPACVKACPSGALKFGERDELLALARRRIAAEPARYVDRIYGEKEAGGTSWLYLAGVPFDQLGFPRRFPDPGMFGTPQGFGRTAPRGWRRLAGLAATVPLALSWLVNRRNAVRRAAGRSRRRGRRWLWPACIGCGSKPIPRASSR